MIRSVRIRGFKRFGDVEFALPGHVVLAGPNDTGKTTLLQAIAAWALALRRWREIDAPSRGNGYRRVPIARQAFVAAPLRSFDLLWTDRRYRGRIEIELRHDAGWAVTMELIADSTEQIYVRPAPDTPPSALREADVRAVFVPPMNGIGTEEPVFQPPKVEQLLCLGRAGEVLRNLLADASVDRPAWEAMQAAIGKLFGYRLLRPDTAGAHILAEFEPDGGRGARLDLASAGSGFQQVLMLLALLHTRRGAVLLLDEPDDHLHVILEDALYHELRSAAAQHGSQLIAATHSAVVINAVEPRELIVTLSRPRPVADTDERNRLIASLRVLDNADVMQALDVRGALYVEDYTDINILRAWAQTLDHRALGLLTTELMWKPIEFQVREGQPGRGITAREHYAALQLVRGDLPGLELRDGDARPAIPDSEITGRGLQRIRWRRYEIESYLLHPDALARFVTEQVGAAAAPHHVDGLLAYWHDHFPPAVTREPLGVHEYLNVSKARTELLPPLLGAAGIHRLPYTRYHEIAALMRPDEIHPEVVEKLDAICRAVGVEPRPQAP